MSNEITLSIDELLLQVEEKYKPKFKSDWIIEQPKVDQIIRETYRFFCKNSKTGHYYFEGCLKIGGSRIVLLVREKNTKVRYVLKVPRPLSDSIKLTANEYGDTLHLNSEFLIRIYDEHDIEIEGVAYPVTTEEYINNSETLGDFVKESTDKISNSAAIEKEIELFINIIAKVVKGLQYLHENHIYHCDVKPENILVTDSGKGVKVIDFGYSKRIPRIPTSSSPFPRFWYTWEYALPELRNKVKKWDSSDKVFSVMENFPDEEESKIYTKIDFYSLGRTIEVCVSLYKNKLDELKVKYFHKSEYPKRIVYEIKYLNIIAGRLKGEDASKDFDEYKGDLIKKYKEPFAHNVQYERHVKSFKTVADDLEKINKESLSFYYREFEGKPENSIRIGQMSAPFTPGIRAIFNSPCFARLANTSQLGLVSFVYPSARNSRLEHSMGAFTYALQYIESLWYQKDDPIFRCLTDPKEAMAASLGALFHDLGQYPNAHDIEDSLQGILKSHASLAKDLYYDNGCGINNVKKNLWSIVNDHYGRDVANKVERYLMIDKTPTPNNCEVEIEILMKVISGPIDTDKLDYVQRDSFNLGVKYAGDIEVEKLIASLRPVVTVLEPDQDKSPYISSLGVSSKGLLAAHSLVIAREHMYERVYWHKTVRSFKAMFKAVLITEAISNEHFINDLEKKIDEVMKNAFIWTTPRTVDAYQTTLTPTEPVESLHLPISDYLMLQELRRMLSSPLSLILLDMITQREHFKVLLEVDPSLWRNNNINEKLTKIKDFILNNSSGSITNLKRIENFRIKVQEKLKVDISDRDLPRGFEKQRLRDVSIIIDFPREDNEQKEIDEVIYNDDGNVKISTHELGTIGILNGQGVVTYMHPRIYMNPFIKPISEPNSPIEYIQKLYDAYTDLLKDESSSQNKDQERPTTNPK